MNRTLLTFADIGVVDVVEVFGGPKRSDPDISNHHHRHCVGCGQMIDFENESDTNLEVPKAIAGVVNVISKRVILKGLCDACKTES